MNRVLAAYEPVTLPFTLDFKAKTKSELVAYSDWFLGGIDHRLSVLENAVLATEGYEAWKADKTPGSLDMLGSWLAEVLEIRERTDAEIEAIRAELAFPVDIRTTELTPRSYSVIFDVGLYVGSVVLANVPGSHWTQVTKDRRHVDYGQVVLVGLGPVPFNPVRVTMVIANGIVEGRFDKSRLRQIYDTRTNYPAK